MKSSAATAAAEPPVSHRLIGALPLAAGLGAAGGRGPHVRDARPRLADERALADRQAGLPLALSARPGRQAPPPPQLAPGRGSRRDAARRPRADREGQGFASAVG